MAEGKDRWESRKVAVVGAGAVGATFAYALAQSGVADEICLLDRNPDLAQGQVLDLAHGMPFYPTVKIRVGDQGDYADARLVVVTAGSAQRPGESRLDLLQRNAAIVGGIVGDIAGRQSPAVVVVVTNPVDVLTYVALQQSGWPRGRVIGSGTVLDSARFRYLIGQHCEVDVHNVHAYILGEHGDSEFAAWSLTHLAGVSIDEYCAACGRCPGWARERDHIARAVRESAYHIIGYKGATSFAIGLALVRIAEAILRDQKSVLAVSVRLDGEYELRDVCLSVPCVVGREGVDYIVEAPLAAEELEALANSAAVLRQALESLGATGERT